jgi:F-type H+-transporting ATPase subunit b
MEVFITVIVNFMNFPLGEGFGINTNLLETNVINLAVVVGVLIYFGGDVLTSLLTNRKETIMKSITDAEVRFQDATDKLNNAKEQLELAKTKAAEIRAQGLVTAEQGAKTLLERAEEDIKRLEETKQTTIRVEEEKAVNQVCEKVSRLALSKAITKVKTRLAKDKNLQRRVLDLNIALLGRVTTK